MAHRWIMRSALTLVVSGILGVVPNIADADAPHSTIGQHVLVPALPFPSHNDPSLCGIPQPMGKSATGVLDGHYQGTLVEPTVYLYDSHLRKAVTGEAPSGTAVQVLYYQSNPTLDFYMVRVQTATGSFEGWVPAPFLHDITTH